MGKNASYLGPLMSMMNFVWSMDITTAATDGLTFWWNPYWFMKLDPGTRPTILVHELWHPGRLHMVRVGSRDHKLWNYACDIRINNDLDKAGYSFVGTKPWLNHDFDQGPKGRMVEEDIYDELKAMQDDQLQILITAMGNPWDMEDVSEDPDDIFGDMIQGNVETSKEDMAKVINNVVQATHQSRLHGPAGDVPGDVEMILKQFLAPILPWEMLLFRFMQELTTEDYSWARPNRRYPDMYLPSRYEDEGKLNHLIYALDVSGSITDSQVIRFNSEVAYIKKMFNPKLLTLIQFDTRITSVKTFTEDQDFVELVVVGRGGTDLRPVRQYLIDNKATAAIIFTDLGCPAMEKLPSEVPIIWVVVGNRDATVPFGTMAHIRS